MNSLVALRLSILNSFKEATGDETEIMLSSENDNLVLSIPGQDIHVIFSGNLSETLVELGYAVAENIGAIAETKLETFGEQMEVELDRIREVLNADECNSSEDWESLMNEVIELARDAKKKLDTTECEEHSRLVEIADELRSCIKLFENEMKSESRCYVTDVINSVM